MGVGSLPKDPFGLKGTLSSLVWRFGEILLLGDRERSRLSSLWTMVSAKRVFMDTTRSLRSRPFLIRSSVKTNSSSSFCRSLF